MSAASRPGPLVAGAPQAHHERGRREEARLEPPLARQRAEGRRHVRLAGADVAHSDGYPGWAPNPQSVLLEKTVGAYERLFGAEPKVRAIHAGLECGLFLEKYPELEMVSFGPTLRGVHSPDERLEIATVPKFWNLLCETLKSL